MVSDSDLVARLRLILQSSDLNTATAASIRRQLEGEFGVSLNDRKAFITEQIDFFIRTQFSQPQNDAVEQSPEEEEVEEEDDDDNGNEEKEDENETEEQADNDQDGSEIDQEEEESDEEGRKRKRSSIKDKNVKRKASGFSKPCALSPKLQELVGVAELARTEVVKRIWAYIREKNLQNPSNKRKIICDHTLRGIFQVDTVDMFKMNKLLSKHIWPIEIENVKSSSKTTQKKQDRKEAATVKSSSKAIQKKQHRQEDDPKQKRKRQKGQTSGFLAPLQMSEALVKFFGTGESELSRADVVKRMWKYIKENELQDPSDKRIILCDDKLKELFEVDSFHGFTMTKLLTGHFIKADGR